MSKKSLKPSKSRVAHRLLVVVAALSLLAAACGSESSTSAVAADEDAAAAADQATDQSSTDDNAGDSDDASDADATSTTAGATKTLDEYLGTLGRGQRGGGGRGAINDDAIAEQAQIEVEVQRCMQAEGFEYVPDDVGGGLLRFLAQGNQGLSAEEFAATKGFGISTRFDEVLEGDVVLEADEVDPNDEHLATLSEGEADAWRFALRGAPIERNEQGQPIDPETGEVLPGQGRGGAGGCRGEANTIVRGDRSIVQGLADEFDALEERIAADPRISEINREWASCIRDAGFAYEDRDEARADINQEFRPLIRQVFGRGAGRGQGGPDLSNISLTPDQETALQQLQDREIAIAQASLKCDGDTPQEIAAIQARYEAEFVDENLAVLESIGG